MKKLIAMIGAVAMSFGLFADAYTISFEQAEVSKGVDTSTMLFTPPVNAGEWAWAGDPLPITAYDEEPTFEYGTGAFARRAGFDGEDANDNYLPLETGTDELVRSMNGNIYLDQLVKFTGFEDPQTNLVEGTKIAIWMSEFEEEDESTTTNLYVTVGKVDALGAVEQIALKIDGTYALNTWYRLSIKSLGNVFGTSEEVAPHAGFLVYVNGQQVKSSDADATTLIATTAYMDGIAKGYMAEGQLFTAIDDTDATFATVGYQGIGAVDDIFIDAEGPKFCQTVDVVIPTVDGAEVDYVDVNGTHMQPPVSVPDGTEITVYFKPTEGMKLTGDTSVTQTITSDDYEIDVEAIVAEEVVATLTPAEDDATELAESELADALAALGEGDVIAITAECSVLDGDENTIYAFVDDTTITGTATGWSILVGEDGAGTLTVNADIAADFTLVVGFESEFGVLKFGGTVEGSLEVPSGVLTVTYPDEGLAVAGTVKAATFDFDSEMGYFVLSEGAKVLATEGEYPTDPDTGYIIADGDLEIKITGPVDDYYTYTAQEVGLIDLEFTNLPTDTAVTLVEGDTVEGNAEDGWKAEEGDALTITLTAQNGKVFNVAGDTTTTVEATAAAQIDLGTAPAPFEAVAKVNDDRFYATLAAAFEAAGDDDEIVLLKNVTIAAPIKVANKVTLNIGDFDITPEAAFTRPTGDTTTTIDAMFVVNYGGDFTVLGGAGVIDCSEFPTIYTPIKLTEKSENGTVVTDSNRAKLTVNANLTGYYGAIFGNGSRGGTDVVINGGTITAVHVDAKPKDDGVAIYNPQPNSTLVINGGTISAHASAVEIRAGSLTVNGGTLTSTAESFNVVPNGDGSTTVGAAVAVAQHTTTQPISAAIVGGTLDGFYAVSVTNPQQSPEENVSVSLGKDATYRAPLFFEADENATVTKDPDAEVAAPEGYMWDGNVLKLIVATVTSGTDTFNYASAAAALAAVQSLESDESNFPIVATALVDGLEVNDPVTGAQIILAQGETITINAASWVFSGGATITPGKPIALAAGATFTVKTAIVGYKDLFTVPADYEVRETYNEAADTYTYSAAQSAAKVVEIVGGDQYATLGEAIAALTGTGDETIKLLADYTTTENLAFNKTCTLDLNAKTLTIPADYRNKPLAALSSSTAYTGVDAGATLTITNGSVVLAEKIAGGTGNYGFYVVGKLINYANWTHDNTGGPVIDLYEGAEVVQNDGVLYSGDIFRSKDGVQAEAIRTVTINGGTMTATGNPAYSYPIIYFTKSGTHNITINGGTFETAVYGYGIVGDTTNMSGLDGDCQAKFKNTVITVSGAKTDLSAYVAEGYELVKGGDDYYTIAKIPSFDVTFTKGEEALGATNVLRDTVLTAEMIPVVEGGEWDVDPLGAVITCNTNFNYTVAVGPEWPEDWPEDVPPAMKEAFATWAEGKGELDFNQKAVQDAFLMNTEVGAVPELKIESISVEGTTATIVVSATGTDLSKINGVLYVDAADDLTNWTTTEVEVEADFSAGKATFEVNAAKFMKAGVGFKAPEAPVTE